MKLTRLLFSEDHGIDESQFKGWRKYYNSYTTEGRANVFKVTVGALVLTALYFKFRPKKQAVTAK